MSVLQAVLCGLACWLVTFSPLNGGQFNQIAKKPLTAAFLCGLIMGDMKAAMAIGVPIQGMFLGTMAIGGVSTMPSANISVYFIIPLCIATGTDVEYAVTLAVAFGVVEQFVNQIKNQINLVPVHMLSRHINEGNMEGIKRAYILGWVIQACIGFGIPFAACMVGQDALIAVVTAMPKWLTGILSVFSKLCPLIGFSLLLMSLVTKPIYLVYALFGFTLTKVAGFTIIESTVVACTIAILFYEITGVKAKSSEEVQ